jgi:hypothetical protein
MVGPAGDNDIFPGSDLLRSMCTTISALSFLVLAVAKSLKTARAMILLYPACTWLFVFNFSANSRVAAIALVSYSATRFALGARRIRVVTVALLALYVMSAVLTGRGTQFHGLANLPIIATLPLEGEQTIVEILINIFQGVPVTADGLLVPGNHHPQYKLLSISPLPSFLDGFSAIREEMELRLHVFVPMSGVTEIARFGPVYWTVVALIYFLLVRQVNSKKVVLVVGQTGIVGANLLLTMFTIIAFSYPLRNTFRQLIYISIAVMVIYMYRRFKHAYTLEYYRQAG